MKLSSQFTVPAEPERVFSLFLDADVMRDSIPGCAELVRTDDETYRGRLENVVAHVRFNAGFSATIVSMDAPRQVKALLTGEDRRLGSSIKIDATLSVQPDAAGSLVGYEMEMALWGKIGRLGEAIVRRRSVEIERQFVERFSAACADIPEATVAVDATVDNTTTDTPPEVATPATPSANTTSPSATSASPSATTTAASPRTTEPAATPAANRGAGAKRGWWRSLWDRILRRDRSGRGRSGSGGPTSGRGSGSVR